MASSTLFTMNQQAPPTNGLHGAEPSMILLPDYLNKKNIFCHKESLQDKCGDSFFNSFIIQSGI
jgi:hypothetical protein